MNEAETPVAHEQPSKPRASAPDLTSGSVPRTLLRLGWQSVAAYTLWEGGELVALICFAQLGMVSVAAYGFALPLMLFVWGIAGLTLAAGAQTFFSNADDDEVSRYFVHFLALFTIVAVVAGGLWWTFSEPLWRLAGAGDDVIGPLNEFLAVYALIYPLTAVTTIGPMMMANRGIVGPIAGHVALASIIVIVGYPVFILGLGPIPELGLAGLAVSIGVGRTYMLFALFRVASKQGLWRRPAGGWFDRIGDSWAGIVGAIGWHGVLKHVFHGSIMVIVVRLVSEFGTDAVAAFIIGNRVGVVATVLPACAAIGLAPMVSQAWKGGLLDRVREVLNWGEVFALASAILSCGFVVLVAPWIVEYFVPNDDADLRRMLRIVVIMFPAIWCMQVLAAPGVQVLKALDVRNADIAMSLFQVIAITLFCGLGTWWIGTFDGVFTGYLCGVVLYAAASSLAARRLLGRRQSSTTSSSNAGV